MVDDAEFPPRPRGSVMLAEMAAKAADAQALVTVDVLRGVPTRAAWCGLGADLVDVHLVRPWMLEVVDPVTSDRFADVFADDPLVMVVPHSVVVGRVFNRLHRGWSWQLPLRVAAAPDVLTFDGMSLPDFPWGFSWEAGWDSATLVSATEDWLRFWGADVLVRPAETFGDVASASPVSQPHTRGGSADVFVGGGLQVDPDAFDGLLRCGVEAAAVVTSTFQAFVEHMLETGLVDGTF